MVFQSSILLPFAPCPLARVHGVRTLENFENVLDEFLEEHAEITYKGALDQSAGISKEAMKTKILNSLDALENSTSTPQQMPQRAKPTWDCESYLSTYSNLENHPGVIREKSKRQIVLDKSGMPKGFVAPGSKKAVAAAAAAAAASEERDKSSSKDAPSDTAAGSGDLPSNADVENKDDNDDTESEGSEAESGTRTFYSWRFLVYLSQRISFVFPFLSFFLSSLC